MDYGKALRIARAIAGVEQKQLAKAAGINASHISLIEKGSRQPSVGTISKICRALGVSEPLFNMLAVEGSDLRGVGEQEFQQIGVYLAKFLIRSDPSFKLRKSKRSKS